MTSAVPASPGSPASPAETVTITVNGSRRTATAGGHLSLLRWLREVAGVTDPKYGCGEGVCGACAVLVDGLPVASCIVLAAQVWDARSRPPRGCAAPGARSARCSRPSTAATPRSAASAPPAC